MKILFIVYDNEGSCNNYPLGACYVASYLEQHGYKDITFYNQDIYHYPAEHLTEYLSKNHFDVVALGFVAGYFQYDKIMSICNAINKVNPKPFVVLGGHGPSPTPEFWIKETRADVVILGEGEIPFLNLVKALENNESLLNVKGIAYNDELIRGNKIIGSDVIINEREKPIGNLDSIPFPYKKLPMEYYINNPDPVLGMEKTDRVISMITSRGCAYNCNFCQRLEKGYRFRSPQNIVEELKQNIKDYHISFVRFLDELFMFTDKQVTELCELILKENINIRYWCAGRFDKVNPKILKLMKRSGCVFISYGIEQFDNTALKTMNKHLTEEDIVKGIEMTQKENILIGFNVIFGNIGDTEYTLKKSARLLKKYNDYRQLRTVKPVIPYPGTALYNLCIEKGILKGPEDFYKKHKNLELFIYNFSEVPDKRAYKLLFEINKKIIQSYYKHYSDETIEKFNKIYFKGCTDFRGARHS